MNMSSRKLDPSSAGLRLAFCALALAGTTVVATGAHAAVITFSNPIPVPNNFDGLYVNLVTGSTSTSGGANPGWDFNPYNSGTALSFFWNTIAPNASGGVATTTTGPYLALSDGTVVSGASTFTAVTATAATNAFKVVGTHNLGVRFYNESTTSINYGFVTLDVAGTTGFPLTIRGWSYEDSGGPITVATIPEPASVLMWGLGALALGATQLRRVRRRCGPTAA
jgi:hypothetical protein